MKEKDPVVVFAIATKSYSIRCETAVVGRVIKHIEDDMWLVRLGSGCDIDGDGNGEIPVREIDMISLADVKEYKAYFDSRFDEAVTSTVNRAYNLLANELIK